MGRGGTGLGEPRGPPGRSSELMRISRLDLVERSQRVRIKSGMDRIDTKILRTLMTDGQTTNARLAKAIGLSESATLERVRRLESSGVIAGYTALVEPTRVDRGLEVLMTFTLRNHSADEVQRFVTAMAEMDEVLSCSQVLGRFDFVSHVAVKDVPALERFIHTKIIPLGAFNHMESLTILKMVKRWHPPLPLNNGD
jgi:Lrp/AsnC family leucine-responsive transcriptional regulator